MVDSEDKVTSGVGKGILIVEDSPVQIHMLMRFLISSGQSVVGVASNGIEALRMYEETRPEIVIMDIHMPLMDGLEAIEKIKALDPDAKIVVVSMEENKEFISKAFECGACNYISKPVHPERFLCVINSLLDSKPQSDQ